MVAIGLITALVCVALLCLVVSVYGVPDMVSSIYYLIGRRGWLFQLAMVVLGIVMMACLLDSGLGEPCLAFIACGGLLFVGAAPRFLEHDERAVHKGAAIISAVASVAWCVTVELYVPLLFAASYGVYLLCRNRNSKPWFAAEVMALWMVLITYLRNV